MTDLEIIKEAYDNAGVGYAVAQHEEGGYYILVLCDPDDAPSCRKLSYRELMYKSNGKFMEFYADGSIASY
jgi:hypothetical protein